LAPKISHMTVQRLLKKTNLNLISGSTGMKIYTEI
jgi:hypothetical protein